MANIEGFFQRLTKEETIEALEVALSNLPEEDAVETIKKWWNERGLNPGLLEDED